MVLHPSGDYAYLLEYDKHFIMRTDYDRVNKTFKIPYTICGASGTSGYADGIGTNARLNNPVQGVFVKNPDYEQSGGDQYDFYFCDRSNHAIRILTPMGRVSTYAGRGNNGPVDMLTVIYVLRLVSTPRRQLLMMRLQNVSTSVTR